MIRLLLGLLAVAGALSLLCFVASPRLAALQSSGTALIDPSALVALELRP